MDIEKYKKFLLSHITTGSIAGGGKVINCRCFECPDSKDPRSKHFYISIPQSSFEPSLYYCHKCHCSGIVSYKKLIEWGIYEESVAIQLTNYNKKCSSNPINNKYYNRIIYRIKNTITTDDNTSKIKLAKINTRLGTSFDYEELHRLKIVLNLNDLLDENMINKLTRNASIVSQLDANFMGFISIDNAFLNMRRLCDEGKVYKSIDKRYINYKIFDKFDTSERFYTIPTQIDLKSPVRVPIHIAEGPFDILSIYKNLRKEELGIYTSIAGSNYFGIAMYFLSTFKIPFVELHYYPDNDKYGSNTVMYRLAELLKPIQAPLYIHRNQYPGEKDFGVSIDRIKESIQKIN
jgi:hypothetical protein